MIIFFILIGFSVLGVLFVFISIQREEQKKGVSLIPLPETKSAPFKGAAKKNELREETHGPVFLKSLGDLGYQNLSPGKTNPTGVVLTVADEKRIEQEIDLTAKLEEWKGKYDRLENLFNEKSEDLRKSEESLRSELNNRKEFNRLKDILEKEIKDIKDKARASQVEVTDLKKENENYLSRINQLEGKVTQLATSLISKEDEVASLNKRLEVKQQETPKSESMVEISQPVSVVEKAENKKGEENG